MKSNKFSIRMGPITDFLPIVFVSLPLANNRCPTISSVELTPPNTYALQISCPEAKSTMTTVPPAAVVVLVMLGASALVVCGYTIHRLMGFGDMPPDQHRSHEQDVYMREVRARNLTGLSREGRHARKAFG
ncbi:hypothetical protein V2W45_1438826 [Cenococcum geophilum]